MSYCSRLMELPQEKLPSRAFEVNIIIVLTIWSAHGDRWLNAHAAHHVLITGSSPDARNYTTNIDSSELILTCKMDRECDVWTYKGARTLTYMRYKSDTIMIRQHDDNIFEDYLSSCHMRKILSRFAFGSR